MLLKHNKCQLAGVACFIKISEFGGQESTVFVWVRGKWRAPSQCTGTSFRGRNSLKSYFSVIALGSGVSAQPANKTAI